MGGVYGHGGLGVTRGQTEGVWRDIPHMPCFVPILRPLIISLNPHRVGSGGPLSRSLFCQPWAPLSQHPTAHWSACIMVSDPSLRPVTGSPFTDSELVEYSRTPHQQGGIH